MKDLNYQLMKLCRDNRDGSYSTQANRSRILDLMANQLAELRFRRMQTTSLKPKQDRQRHHRRGQQRLRHRQANERRRGLQGAVPDCENSLENLGSVRSPQLEAASGVWPKA